MRKIYFPGRQWLSLISLSVLVLAVCGRASAQGGTSVYDAIAVPACGVMDFTDYQDTGYGFSDSYGNSSPEVWYTFTLPVSGYVEISTCGSSFDTYLHVLDQYQSEILSDDDNGCGGNTSLVSDYLPAGTYYIVAEGYSDHTGDLAISMTGSGGGSAAVGADMSGAISAGTFGSTGGSYTDTRSNADACLGDDMGQPSNDIYYSFTLTAASQVTLSHCGSGFDTYMHLLNSGGTELISNDDSYSSSCYSESYIETTLDPGTYYVVSEGYSDNTGYIVTTVTATPVAPVTISYPSPSYTFTAGAPVAPVVPTIGNAPAFEGQTTATYAGSGSQGSVDGPATGATFNWPLAAAMDGSGNLYVADSRNHRIRRISPSGTVSTLAGSGSSGYADGTGSGASFSNPAALAVDASGNVYVVDQQNNAVRKITPAGVVTTVAGNGTSGFANGTGTAARFSGPAGICIDGSGNLYVGDSGNNRIRRISPSGTVSTYAGSGAVGAANGPAASASFRDPRGLAMDASGNVIVCDRQNYLVRSISPSGTVSTLAGSGVQGWVDGPATSARFGGANSAAIDGSGNIYVIDQGGNHMVRKITPAGTVSTLAGYPATGSTDGTGSVVRFNTPYGICPGQDGILYVADTYNNKIRKIDIRPLNITPSLPAGLAFNYSTGAISGTPTAVSPATVYTVTGYGVSTTLTIAVSASCLSLSQDRNYIVSYTPLEAGMTEGSSVTANSCDPYKVNTSVQYFDGLGRPLQTVSVKGNGDGTKDIVTPIEYDGFGREAKKYLPYTSTSGNASGSYRVNGLGEVVYYYLNQPTGMATAFNTPYAQTVFEDTRVGRVLEQGAPGTPWQPASSGLSGAGHTVKMEYGTNTASEVYHWNSAPGVHIVGIGNFFNAGELFKTVTKDENWASGKAGTLEEFKDKLGRIVLKRRWETEVKCQSTYYVYDNWDNLLYVLPPEVTETGSSAHGYYYETDPLFLQYIYAYHYDYRNRVIEKKIPGKGWEYIIYNKMDQIVATQDAEQRKNNQWLVNKYDAMGRVTMTGFATASRTAAQNGVDGQSRQWEERTATGTGYTEHCWPGGLAEVLTVNYYDSYNFPGNTFGGPAGSESAHVTGLLTGTKVRILGTADMLLTASYYDTKGRLVESRADNHLGGTDINALAYNFTGQVTSGIRTHTAGGQTTTIVTGWNYDHMGRKLMATESINGVAPVVLSKLSYNEIGQMIGKGEHSTDGGSTFLNSTAYTYNPRGWLKEQTNTATGFNMDLSYESGTYPQYNGNISAQNYTNGGSPNIFTYQYDKLGRLASAVATGMSEVLTYDDMGNIKSLNRDNGGANLYTYIGNRLQSVANVTPTPYQYDDNGNATTDGRNGMALAYNYLNLPITATKTGTAFSYTYDATGRKLRKTVNGQTRDYMDGIEYSGSTIDIIHTEEGVARNNNGNYSYEYNITDHLGNVRATFYRNPNSGAIDILQRDDYYAFGKRRSVPLAGGGISLTNKYLYNGKELQDELGEQYDYGARFYDPVIGRWNVVDPLAEKFYNENPYGYTGNNPVLNTDPTGMAYVGVNVEYYEGAEAQAYMEGVKQAREGKQDQSDEDGDNKKKKTSEEGDDEPVYDGKGYWGTNFIGPGPDVDPYTIRDPNDPNKFLQPKDLMDAGARKHDYAYWKNKASGITGALLDKSVARADVALMKDALKVLLGYDKKAIDPYTGAPISSRTMQAAYAVYFGFSAVSAFKYLVLR